MMRYYLMPRMKFIAKDPAFWTSEKWTTIPPRIRTDCIALFLYLEGFVGVGYDIPDVSERELKALPPCQKLIMYDQFCCAIGWRKPKLFERLKQLEQQKLIQYELHDASFLVNIPLMWLDIDDTLKRVARKHGFKNKDFRTPIHKPVPDRQGQVPGNDKGAEIPVGNSGAKDNDTSNDTEVEELGVEENRKMIKQTLNKVKELKVIH